MASLVALIQTGTFDAVVIDPTVLRGDTYEEILDLVRQVGVPVYIYAALTTAGADLALHAAALLPTEVCFFGVRRETELLRRALLLGRPITASAWLLHHLASKLQVLPTDIRTAAVSVFGGVDVPHSVDDLARACRKSRRAVERHVATAGFVSTKRLLDVARLASAWEILHAETRTLHEVCDRAGYSSVRTLVDHFQFFCGSPPRRLASRANERHFAGQLVRSLVVGGERGSERVMSATAPVETASSVETSGRSQTT